MQPSEYIIEMIEDLEDDYSDDAIELCLVIEHYFIQEMAENLQDPNLTFGEKFQLIADIKYCSDYLEHLVDALSVAIQTKDPFYSILGYLDKDIKT